MDIICRRIIVIMANIPYKGQLFQQACYRQLCSPDVLMPSMHVPAASVAALAQQEKNTLPHLHCESFRRGWVFVGDEAAFIHSTCEIERAYSQQFDHTPKQARFS